MGRSSRETQELLDKLWHGRRVSFDDQLELSTLGCSLQTSNWHLMIFRRVIKTLLYGEMIFIKREPASEPQSQLLHCIQFFRSVTPHITHVRFSRPSLMGTVAWVY
jgi:hypothetical protein